MTNNIRPRGPQTARTVVAAISAMALTGALAAWFFWPETRVSPLLRFVPSADAALTPLHVEGLDPERRPEVTTEDGLAFLRVPLRPGASNSGFSIVAAREWSSGDTLRIRWRVSDNVESLSLQTHRPLPDAPETLSTTIYNPPVEWTWTEVDWDDLTEVASPDEMEARLAPLPAKDAAAFVFVATPQQEGALEIAAIDLVAPSHAPWAVGILAAVAAGALLFNLLGLANRAVDSDRIQNGTPGNTLPGQPGVAAFLSPNRRTVTAIRTHYRGAFRIQRTLLILGLLTATAAVAVFVAMPSEESTSFLPLTESDFGREYARGNLFTYHDNVLLEPGNLHDGPTLAVTIDDRDSYSGFGIIRDTAVPPGSHLRLRWRSRGQTDYINVELNDTHEDLPDKLTWAKSTNAPASSWSLLEIPVEELTWNPNVNPPVEPRPLNHEGIESFAVTMPPGTDIQLEFSAIEVVTPTSKGILSGGLLFSAVVLFSGRQIFLLVYERRQAEATLQTSETRYQNIFNSVDEGIAVIDPATARIMEVNRAACSIFQLPRDTLLQSKPSRLDWLETVSDGREKTFEWEGVTASGNRLYAEIHTHRTKVDDRPQLVAIIRDIRKRKAEERKRRELENQLRHSQKMDAVGKLAGGVAHDFNNLLTGIVCACQLIRDSDPDAAGSDDKKNRMLDQIVKLSERGSALTRQLLAFSRDQSIQRTHVAANELVHRAIDLIERVIGENIRLDFHSEAETDTLWADGGQLEQVLMNLAINARDAMPDGGTLKIRMDNLDLAPGTTTELKPGRYLRLRLSDEGHGIEKETRRRIFEPFFTTKETGKGTGLGLSVVYGIINQHQGSIAVESELGRGTTFTILLPATDKTEDQMAGKQSDFVPHGSETVFVIEDDDGVRDLIVASLESHGYNVISAESTKAAEPLFSAHATEIALLLSDVLMPDENGPDFFMRIRKQYPNLKALFMSGYSEFPAGDPNRINAVGPLLKKPFSPKELCHLIRSILDETNADPLPAAE